MPWEIDIVSQQSALKVNTDLLQTAVAAVLQQEQLVSAIVSISIVDNETIHRINRQYLQHDYPTDVITSLVLTRPSCPRTIRTIRTMRSMMSLKQNRRRTLLSSYLPPELPSKVKSSPVPKWRHKWPLPETGRLMPNWPCTWFTACCTSAVTTI